MQLTGDGRGPTAEEADWQAFVEARHADPLEAMGTPSVLVDLWRKARQAPLPDKGAMAAGASHALMAEFAAPTLPDAVLAALRGAEGLAHEGPILSFHRLRGQSKAILLPHLTPSCANALRRGLVARFKGLRLTLCDAASESCDLFLRPGVPQASLAMEDLARLGIASPQDRCGALASDLPGRVAHGILQRLARGELCAVPRKLQRFDLVLTQRRDMPADVFRDLQRLRPHLRATARPPGPGSLIERELTRGQALMFQSDYGAMGLQTSLALCGYCPDLRHMLA